MDRRTNLALALSMIVLVLWQIFAYKTAPRPKPVSAPQHTSAPAPAAASAPASAPAPVVPGSPAAAVAALVQPAVPEHVTVIETPLYRATFSNLGARLVSFELKRFAAAYGKSRFALHPGHRPAPGHEVGPGDRVVLGGGPTFGIDMGSGANVRSLAQTTFAVRESADADHQVRMVEFTTQDPNGLVLVQTWRVRPDSYLLDLAVETKGIPSAQRMGDYSLTLRSWAMVNEENYKIDQRSMRATCLVGTDLHRDAATSLVSTKTGQVQAPKTYSGTVHWAAVQSHYFLAAVGPVSGDGRAVVSSGYSGVQQHFGSEPSKSADPVRGFFGSFLPMSDDSIEARATCTLVMPLPTTGAGVQRFVTCFGPSDYFSLASHSGTLQLERAVDMGWGWLLPVTKFLLWLLRQVNTVVHNFGITILLLATIVRLALHPLNMSSMKSMRAMQRLQPEMERIKDKYKNDAQAQNAAIMALYKENGVNPAGGCLPMFLQMPLFFAMYQVISNAIDLRQASFLGWIHDLSAPDVMFSVAGQPIHLLPLLMAGTGFLSQRFTPTDPKQAPTMYMMNFVMLFVFWQMPSGLVFYWTVMNLLTAVQQWLSMRGAGTTVVVPVEAPVKKKRRQ